MPVERTPSFVLGMRHMAPLFVGIVPFGLVLGVAISEAGIPPWIGWLSSSLIFGGAAQLAAVTLLGAGAPALSAIAAALVVNARHVMYSAALVPHFRRQPRWFRWLGPYLLVDQVFALSTVRPEEPDSWRRYYLGAGLLAWTVWQVVVAVGIVAGSSIPGGLDLEFAIPLLFIGLFVPTLKRRPPLVGALVGVAVTAVFAFVPNRGGMLIGSLVGVVVATVMEGREPGAEPST